MERLNTGLGARPSAAMYDLESLVTQAWQGRIRVPHFQRDFRWGRQDVIRLFDSIVKGYPIGSLLLWVRPAPEQVIRLGALELLAPQEGRALWVVDGQQRVTSLANALHPAGSGDARFSLVYNLRSGQFAPRPAQDNPWAVPLPVIFDLQKLLRWFNDYPEIAEHLDMASGITKTIRQFPIPAYLVEQGNEQVLQDIFDRMNNYGKRLSRAEVFSALFAGDEASRDERLTIDAIASRIDTELGFGLIDGDTVLLAILARRGPDVMREIRTEFDYDRRRGPVEYPGEGRDDAYRAGEAALRRAVVFLQETAGVPHLSMIPYRYLLVVLCRIFAHFPELETRNLRLLRRWYWRAAVVGPGKGSSTGTMRTFCSRVRPGNPSTSIQGLLDAASSDSYPVPDLKEFRTNSAEAKIVLCSWWDLAPRSPFTGREYDRTQLSESLVDHRTAAPALQTVVPVRSLPAAYSTWAANRILAPPEEDVPAEEIDRFLVTRLSLDFETWKDMLRSHAITDEAAGQLAAGDIKDFIETRSGTLREHLSGFLRRMCEWEFEDTPPLEDLLMEDLDADEDDGGEP